jgi:hypothetical protein
MLQDSKASVEIYTEQLPVLDGGYSSSSPRNVYVLDIISVCIPLVHGCTEEVYFCLR